MRCYIIYRPCTDDTSTTTTTTVTTIQYSNFETTPKVENLCWPTAFLWCIATQCKTYTPRYDTMLISAHVGYTYVTILRLIYPFTITLSCTTANSVYVQCNMLCITCDASPWDYAQVLMLYDYKAHCISISKTTLELIHVECGSSSGYLNENCGCKCTHCLKLP